jgi:hypothetical protein
MRSFTVPWIPHDDNITPQDIQGVRGFGSADSSDPLAVLMERKLTRMRAKHAQTREFMEINALRGTVRDGAGTTLYNYFTEFGLTRLSVDFDFGDDASDIQAIIRDVLRKIETELKGESMSSVLALVSPFRSSSVRAGGRFAGADQLPGRRFCRRWQPLFRLAAAEARQQLFLCILGGGSLRRGSGFQ